TPTATAGSRRTRPGTTASWTRWSATQPRSRRQGQSPDPPDTEAEERTVSSTNRPLAQAPRHPELASARLQPAQARYVVPSFVERTSYGIKEMNPYNKLFEERIIFLGVQIDDASANDVIAQLIALESMDPDRDVTMYINSPGGSVTSMMA